MYKIFEKENFWCCSKIVIIALVFPAFAANSANGTIAESRRLTAYVRSTVSTSGALYAMPVLDIRLFPHNNHETFFTAERRLA